MFLENENVGGIAKYKRGYDFLAKSQGFYP